MVTRYLENTRIESNVLHYAVTCNQMITNLMFSTQKKVICQKWWGLTLPWEFRITVKVVLIHNPTNFLQEDVFFRKSNVVNA